MANKKPEFNSPTSNYYVVRPDSTPEDGYRDYDTLSGIAAEWLKRNPEQSQFKGDFKAKHRAVQEWMIEQNKLKTRDGKECDSKKIEDATIKVGQPLILPVGKGITNPPQHREKCPVEVPPAAKEEVVTPTRTLQPQPPVPAPTPAPAPEKVPAATPIVPPPLGKPRETQEAGAKLPVYPKAGNLAGGRTADMYDAANLIPLFGRKLNQPEVAARGQSPHGVGIQTVGDIPAAAMGVLPILPLPFTAGPMKGVVAPLGLEMDVQQSQNRVALARGGSNATMQDQVADEWRTDVSPLTGAGLLRASERTRIDATLLPGLGVTHDKDGRLRDIPGDPYNNNQYYYTMGEGESRPSVTISKRMQEEGKKNRFLQGTPSSPVGVPLNNYAIAALVDQDYVVPQIKALSNAVAENPTKQNVQELVSLYTLRSELTGMSNYAVKADVSKKLGDEEIARLNPRERVLYDRQRVLDFAQSKGISDIDTKAVAAVRSIPRTQLRDNMIEYYTQMAYDEPRAFGDVYQHIHKQRPDMNVADESSRREFATKFVDALPYLQSYPEQGFELKHMKPYYHAPREQFTGVERFEYLPKQAPKSAAAVASAMEAITSSPENVAAILQAAGSDARIAQAIADRDNYVIQLPRQHGKKTLGFTRQGMIDEVASRGYRQELMDLQFTRDETNGIIRNMPAVQEDLANSAKDPKVLEGRIKDFNQMASDGVKGKAIGLGAHANQLLHALAVQGDNETLLKIEDNIRKSAASPQDAEKKIEALRQGVTWAKDHITARHTGGTTHTQLGAYVAAGSIVSAPEPDAAKLNKPGFGLDSFVDNKKITNVRQQDIANTVAYFVTPTTQATALTAINETNPSLMTAAIIKTLADHPELQKPVLDSLRDLGDAKSGFFAAAFNTHAQGKFANELEALFAAQNAGDEKQVAAITSRIDAMVKSGKTAQLSSDLYRATSDLFVATVTSTPEGASVTGREALTQTLVQTVQAAANGQANPLPGFSLNSEQTLASIYTAVTKFDPSNGVKLSAEAHRVIANNQTIDGHILPFLALFYRQATSSQPLPPGDVPDCTKVTCTPTLPPGNPVPPVNPPGVPPVPPPIPGDGPAGFLGGTVGSVRLPDGVVLAQAPATAAGTAADAAAGLKGVSGGVNATNPTAQVLASAKLKDAKHLG